MINNVAMLNHFKLINHALEVVGCRASLDLKSFVLEVWRGMEKAVFHPQFLNPRGTKLMLSEELGLESTQFCGWLPYTRRPWPQVESRLAFKSLCREIGILAPPYSTDPGTAPGHVVVRRDGVSPQGGVRGPFASANAPPIGDGEFYEQFVPGQIIKAWIWNGLPVCAELQAMPTVVGDGKRSIAQLAADRLARRRQKAEVSSLTGPLVEFLGKSLADILPSGEQQAVDFRYGSAFQFPRLVKHLLYPGRVSTVVESQLRDIGEKLWRVIPPAIRNNTLVAVTGVLDDEERIWALAAKCTPPVHPATYLHMVSSLFGIQRRSVADASLRPVNVDVLH